MDIDNGSPRNSVGKSTFQEECRKFYQVLREVHSSIFTTEKRKTAEEELSRYTDTNVDGIKNLYTFIESLALLLRGNEKVCGVDYGCGSHYFVDDMQRRYGWDVIGYDVDAIAIAQAREKYANSKDRYQVLDLLREKMPLPDSSQNFVFCNAVIQHFDDRETEWALTDIARVLTPGGILLLIFKRKVEDWERLGLRYNVKDRQAGIVEIEDTVIKAALDKLGPQQRSEICSDFFTGMRTLHFFAADEIVSLAPKTGLAVVDRVQLSNGISTRGVFTYNSGKGMPTAAVFFSKT